MIYMICARYEIGGHLAQFVDTVVVQTCSLKNETQRHPYL